MKLLAGKLFLMLHLKSSSVIVEKEVLLSQCVDIAEDVYVERAFILQSNVGHQGQLAMATWMSNDELCIFFNFVLFCIIGSLNLKDELAIVKLQLSQQFCGMIKIQNFIISKSRKLIVCSLELN